MNWPVHGILGVDKGLRSRFRAQRKDCEEDRKLYSRRTRVGAGAGLDVCVRQRGLFTSCSSVEQIGLWYRPVGLGIGSLTAVDATMSRAWSSSCSYS